MEEDKGGISLGDIFRIIFSQKWLALIIAAVITVAGTLTLYFGYNHLKMQYVVNFTLELPADDAASATYHYPDGQPFSYYELISKPVLDEVVVEGDGKYDGLDVANLVKNGISVSESLNVTSVGTGSIVERKYTITVSAKYFKDGAIAQDFLSDVANYPRKYLSNLNIKYDGALNQFDTADDYLKQIEYLNKQVNFIMQNYTDFISQYGALFAVGGSKTLSTNLDEIYAYSTNPEFTNLKQQLKEKKFLKDESNRESYKLESLQVKEDWDDADSVLQSMLYGQSDMPNNAEAIRVQAEKVATLKRKYEDLDYFCKNGVVDTEGEFAAKLKVAYDKITAYTKTLNDVSKVVYTNSFKVSVDPKVVSTGGFGLSVILVLSLVIGVIIAAIVAYIVGWNKLKKANAQTAPPVVESGELIAQAAVSNDENEGKNE